MCYRQASCGLTIPDFQLFPTTRDEVGQYGTVVHGDERRDYEVCADGTRLLNVRLPVVLQHKYEEDLLIPPGLYVFKGNNLWPGAPISCNGGTDNG